MNGLVVYKMTGSGNDFVFADGRTLELAYWTPARVRTVCDRHRGVGADGFGVVEPGSEPGAVRFHFFNNDGHRAAMCGNGALCATRIAAYLELADPAGMILETDAGRYQSRCLEGEGERAELLLGDLPGPARPRVALAPGEREAYLMTVGVPHLVVLVDEISQIALPVRGRALRYDPALGTAGANVNFVARKPDGSWTMRTYERGVEAETLACGTGAAAAASVLALTGQASLPLELETASGCRLGVAGQASAGDSGARHVSLQGEGRLVFRAILGRLPGA